MLRFENSLFEQAAHELESRDAAEPETARSQGHPSTGPQQRRDRILIFLTSGPSTAMLIRRGRRMADYLEADCFAV